MILLLYSINQANAQKTDVVIYGATASGVMAAIAAAKEGVKVTLVEPGNHIGGMLTGGLSHTDYGDRTVIGGLAAEFYQKVADYYKVPIFYWRGPEPKVGEQLLKEWLIQYKVNVLYGKRVIQVEKESGVISALTFKDGTRIQAKAFIDASYEGDLMAKAKVSYTFGREGKKDYNETWAGRQPITFTSHQIDVKLSPFIDEKQKLILPLIKKEPMVEIGEADKGIQSYCFRMIATNNLENMIPWPKPNHYNPENFELIKRYYQEKPEAGPLINFIPTLPHQKADINSAVGISTNLLDGSSWRYPDADYELRDSIWQWHKDYTLGLTYFLAHDSSVPEHVRNKMKTFGLCKDEYINNANFPHQLYVREARRMKGEYFMTEHDLLKDTIKYDAIGMGSYNMDVREMQRSFIGISRFPDIKYEVYNEGYLSIPVAQYEIPYRALVPKYEECKNLLVSVCVSGSHLAISSIRMEPQYMIMGQAAGLAAALAIKTNRAVQQIDIFSLQQKLKAENQILSLKNNPYGLWNKVDDIVIDNNMKGFISFTGDWKEEETKLKGRYEMNFRSKQKGKSGTFTFKPYLFKSGQYNLYYWSPANQENETEVPLEIHTSSGLKFATINQKNFGGEWIKIGSYSFEKGNKHGVTIIGDKDKYTVADAFRFEYIKNQ
ncbi:FAD-dependent oxidoreductase [Pedobacter glucosidilyticus]|uniref:FAD-dependent oxidoreductase n=1 Tax=Pedobacter glucosidilyticus TaxID=1122941 RepID=UPI0026EAAF33|nr:FAD-dependent oxidoreductase [Pedobacter glucosidilyticus]